jgi:hypothetical protein
LPHRTRSIRSKGAAVRVVAFALSAALAFGGAQAALFYPGRPLKMVAPFSGGHF